jgi:hypothetical protein
VSDSPLSRALADAAKHADRAVRRHDTDAARALRDALRAAAEHGDPPARSWLAATIRDTAAWATGTADVALLASLGAIARALPPE